MKQAVSARLSAEHLAAQAFGNGHVAFTRDGQAKVRRLKAADEARFGECLLDTEPVVEVTHDLPGPGPASLASAWTERRPRFINYIGPSAGWWPGNRFRREYPMDRAQAYGRKVSIIVEGLALLDGVGSPNELEQEGILHVVQVAIDAAMDLVAMQVKDLGHAVSDDYHNLQTLQDAGRLDPALADGLRSLNGLRNAIVHRYNTFERERVEEGLPEIRELLLALTERVP